VKKSKPAKWKETRAVFGMAGQLSGRGNNMMLNRAEDGSFPPDEKTVFYNMNL
jgi:hypothetical protein